MTLFSTSLQLPADFKEEEIFNLAQGLEGCVQAHIAKKLNDRPGAPWHLEWYSDEALGQDLVIGRLSIQAEILGLSIPDFQTLKSSEVEEQDWLQQVYEELKPFSIGPFFIYGSHYDGDVPEGQMGIQMDAATAFGSGDHGTTKGCLRAMLDLKGKGICPWNVLDMGCGSGILSIAAWKLWQTPILAVDIDEEAVRVTDKYADLNMVQKGSGGLMSAAGPGFDTPEVGKRAPYDLVLANILAGPLIDMAPDLAVICDDLGYVVLSGMLKEQANDVIQAYEAAGLTLKDRIDIGKWSTLLLQKP